MSHLTIIKFKPEVKQKIRMLIEKYYILLYRKRKMKSKQWKIEMIHQTKKEISKKIQVLTMKMKDRLIIEITTIKRIKIIKDNIINSDLLFLRKDNIAYFVNTDGSLDSSSSIRFNNFLKEMRSFA